MWLAVCTTRTAPAASFATLVTLSQGDSFDGVIKAFIQVCPKKTKKSRLILKGARISMSAMQIIFTSMGWNIAGITQHAGVNQLSHSIFDSVGYFRVWNICEFWFNLIICSNTVGSLSCSCTSGYVEWSAINGCRDKNECTEVPTYFQYCQ